MNKQSRQVVQVAVGRPQASVLCCDNRFRVLVAGRRFGKTQIALLELFRAICGKDRTAWYVAPTYRQAKRVAWRRLKQLVRPYAGLRISESDLRIDFPWRATIALRGADNYDALRGEGLDFVVLDEYACMSPEAWTEVLRPMLSDRRGGAMFIGTPKGFNHFCDLADRAHAEPDWAVFRFTTQQGGNVADEELLAAARELDARTYRQEFEASFEHLGSGRVYYAFDRERNVQPLRYWSGHPLFWSLDFNVNPMCSVVGQVVDGVVHVLQEIVLPDSNTFDACRAFLNRMEAWPLYTIEPLWVYGDATGDHRQSSASRTDWQIVQENLAGVEGRLQISYRYYGRNPQVPDRVHCMNAALCNQLGNRRLLIDPSCRELIRDLDQVAWKEDTYGNSLKELDKSDRKRTHTSDALGYMVARYFSMDAPAGFRRERLF